MAGWAFVAAGMVTCGLTAFSQSVAGIVRDERGRPVRNADITVERASGTVQLATGPNGAYSSEQAAGAGHVRLTVAAKGYDPISVETTAPKNSPSCQANLTLQKHRRGVAPLSQTITCARFTPYAAMLQFRAAFEIPGTTAMNLQPGMLTQFSSHIADGNTTSTMWINGVYVFQVKPPSGKPLLIQVPGAPDDGAWTSSDTKVVQLVQGSPEIVELKTNADGVSHIVMQDAGLAVLRIQVQVLTSSDTWQVKLFRETLGGEIIWQDGSAGDP